MPGNHLAIGVALLALTLGFVAARYARAPARQPLTPLGWLGLIVIVAAEILLALRTSFVTVFFTPIVWTGYLFLIRALIASLGADSRLASPGTLLPLAFWSVPLWLIFEAYNLRLKNWTYVGVPLNPLVAGLGYVWSFATIWPAIFGTADFLRALGLFRKRAAPRCPWRTETRIVISVLGFVLVVLPIVLPAPSASYLFGLVWVGFILLLDPLNGLLNGRSLLHEWQAGEHSMLLYYLASGWVCGMLWEFWNYWADAKWHYIFPILQGWKVFEMPIPGYLGFPPFAVECFVMYEFLCTTGRGLRQVLTSAYSRQ